MSKTVTCGNIFNDITAITIRLFKEFPFYATILGNLRVLVKEEIDTLQISPDLSMGINPDFWDNLSLDEKIFCICHEIGHIVRKGHSRGISFIVGDKKEVKNLANKWRLWNISQDLLINEELLSKDIGKMPSGGISRKYIEGLGIKLPENIDTLGSEDVYSLLTPEMEKFSECSVNEIIPFEFSEEFEDLIEMGQSVNSQHIHRVYDGGNAPFDLNREMSSYIGHQLLKSKRNYQRPSRRNSDSEMMLRGRVNDNSRPKVLFVVDTSGSIEDFRLADIQKLLTEVDSDIIYHDTDVYTTPQGGGGTDFRPVFDFLADKEYDLVVWQTDGDGVWPTFPDNNLDKWLPKLLFVLVDGHRNLDGILCTTGMNSRAIIL